MTAVTRPEAMLSVLEVMTWRSGLCTDSSGIGVHTGNCSSTAPERADDVVSMRPSTGCSPSRTLLHRRDSSVTARCSGDGESPQNSDIVDGQTSAMVSGWWEARCFRFARSVISVVYSFAKVAANQSADCRTRLRGASRASRSRVPTLAVPARVQSR